MTTTRPKLFTVDEYYQMSALSILLADERTELLDGEILLMAAKNPPHSAITKTTADYLRELMRGLADIRVQEPVRLSLHSEPEPDIAVVQIDDRNYIDHHPNPNQVFLVIEVADATLNFDRKRKAASYSKAKIADYWVIDVKDEQVFVFREPGVKTYQQQTVVGKGGVLSAIAYPGIQILVERFFP